jgi:hypothetical protein
VEEEGLRVSEWGCRADEAKEKSFDKKQKFLLIPPLPQLHSHKPNSARMALPAPPALEEAASWATSRVLALLDFCALVAGVCVLLLWQIITGICKHACLTVKSILAPRHQPLATPGADNWAVERATALPEVWALVAENSDGLVDVWRLMSVCRASREGATTFLSTLPGLVVCGGYITHEGGGGVRDAWRLDLAALRWELMPALVTARAGHACCAVRGTLVVLGGDTPGEEDFSVSSEVEMLSSGAFVDLPPLSRGGIHDAAAIEVDESDSAAGQVLLIGGGLPDYNLLSTVHCVDLATGACARQPDLLHSRVFHAAARLPDGRIICAGGLDGDYVG